MTRFASFALALTVFLLGRGPVALANPESDESADEPGSSPAAASVSAGGDDATGTASPADGAGGKATKKRARKVAKKAKVVGVAVPDSKLRTEPLPRPSGFLHVSSLALGDEADVSIFNDDGSFDPEALKELDHVLRCKRTDAEKPIDPRLYVILSHIYDHFGQKRIDIVSGYRNQRRQTSFHYKGAASDIRIEGVSPKKIRAFAETLDTGGMGIGFYPRALFVHVDVRPLPSYRWIDNSRPTPNSPDKRPPRGWKRKKLQS